MTTGSGPRGGQSSGPTWREQATQPTEAERFSADFNSIKDQLTMVMPDADVAEIRRLAAQTALKQQEARLVQPPPPPPRPTRSEVSTHDRTRTDLVDPSVLSAHVPYSVKKALSACIEPLSTSTIPAKRSLKAWWPQCEMGLKMAHRDLPTVLTAPAIEQLGPILLGIPAWNMISDQVFSSWQAFRAAVDKEFGFTSDEEIAQFFGMVATSAETDAQFVLRVEAQRKLIDQSSEAALYSFVPRLSEAFRVKLDWLMMSDRGSSAPLTWQDVVDLAKRERYSLRWAATSAPSIISGPPSTLSLPATEQYLPLPPTVGVEPPVHGSQRGRRGGSEGGVGGFGAGAGGNSATRGGQGVAMGTNAGAGGADRSGRGSADRSGGAGYRNPSGCPTCRALNIGLDNHDPRKCWVNPTSPEFKPEVRDRRLQTCYDSHGSIPPEILAQNPFTPRKKSASVGTQNMLSAQEVSNMVASLCNAGPVDVVDAELLVEQLIVDDSDVDRPGLVGVTFRHLSDGPAPVHANTANVGTPLTLDALAERAPPAAKPRVRQLLDQLDALAANVHKVLASQDAAAQTGGVPGAGKVVGGGAAPKRTADLASVVKRISTSLPIVKVMKLDSDLRRLLLAEMVAVHNRAGQSLVIPATQIVHRVTEEEFAKYRELLSGITATNVDEVAAELEKMGILPTAGSMDHAPAEPAAKRPRVDEHVESGGGGVTTADTAAMVQRLVGCMSEVVQAVLAVLVPDLVGSVAARKSGELASPLGVIPPWAAEAIDSRKTLRWDSDQYIANVLVNGKVLVLAIVDTGSCQTLIDVEMARDLHLSVKVASQGEYGCYLVPGSTYVKSYYGMVDGVMKVQLADGVTFELSGIRVVEHSCPLFLLGADVMRGGRVDDWNFAGIRTTTVGPGHVQGSLEFEHGDARRTATLVYCPSVGTERFTSSMLGVMSGGWVAHVQSVGGPRGPQLVRRAFDRRNMGSVARARSKRY